MQKMGWLVTITRSSVGFFKAVFFSSILMDSQPFVEKSKSCEFLMLFQIELSTPQPIVHSEFVATFVILSKWYVLLGSFGNFIHYV